MIGHLGIYLLILISPFKSIDSQLSHMDSSVPNLLSSMLRLRCPRCRHGKLFSQPNPYNIKRMESMPDQCPSCGQDFQIEPGFYFGATYVSYALNVGWLIPTFLTMHFGLALPYRYFVITMFALLPILVPLIFRLSRSIWIHFFVNLDPQVAQQVREGASSE
jgi:uncharacterized protein (DUF983 family)